MSALDLCNKCDIPATTVYRRIAELLQAGLIASVMNGRTTDGKWYELYRSLLKRINITFENGDMRVEAEMNDQVDAVIKDHVADKFSSKAWTSIPLY
jgi:predicted ArsR family transcriptional regulator